MIFISHTESQCNIASNCVDYLLASLSISDDEVRCTSVPGHQLPFGETISEQLKKDISISSAVIALITKESLQSDWVVFELGASWALSKTIILILSPEVSASDLPGPLSGYPCIEINNIDASSRIKDSIKAIAKKLDISEESGGKAQSKLEIFIKNYKEIKTIKPYSNIDQAKAFEISWLIMTVVSGQSQHTHSTIEVIKNYISEIGINPIKELETYINSKDNGKQMDLLEIVGGNIVVVRPDLVDYYQAGMNLLIASAKNNRMKFLEILSPLNIPKNLLAEKENKIVWANDVHHYFESILRNKRNSN